jgi:hypothetical protein
VILRWLDKLRARRRDKNLAELMAEDKELRQTCLELCQYMELANAEEMIRNAELLREYVERGR